MTTIINECSAWDDNCIVEVDGSYFGYDNHPQYPETRYSDINKAHVFNSQEEAFALTKWYRGNLFKILPASLIDDKLPEVEFERRAKYFNRVMDFYDMLADMEDFDYRDLGKKVEKLVKSYRGGTEGTIALSDLVIGDELIMKDVTFGGKAYDRIQVTVVWIYDGSYYVGFCGNLQEIKPTDTFELIKRAKKGED